MVAKKKPYFSSSVRVLYQAYLLIPEKSVSPGGSLSEIKGERALVMEIVKQTCNRVLERSKRCKEGQSSHNVISKVRKSLGKISNNKKKQQLAPEGCFWVYVGPQRERFLMKIEVANHPMFKLLLDDAETEFGYRSEGPIWLPCDVNFFCEAVAEMEMEIEEDHMSSASSSWACCFHNHKSYPN